MSTSRFLIIILLLSLGPSAGAQVKRPELQKNSKTATADSTFKGFTFPSRDSILHVYLGTIEMVGPYRFKNKREEKKYNQLEADVLKTFPLALIVGTELKIVNTELENGYSDKAKRKIYMKWYQKYVYKTYIDTLKTLNAEQGRLLLKLIHRETGKTPYDLIRYYRGGFNALIWESLGFMAGANLNSKYDPGENKMIEHIIQRYKSGEFN
jgi:hypothetical protein